MYIYKKECLFWFTHGAFSHVAIICHRYSIGLLPAAISMYKRAHGGLPSVRCLWNPRHPGSPKEKILKCQSGNEYGNIINIPYNSMTRERQVDKMIWVLNMLDPKDGFSVGFKERLDFDVYFLQVLQRLVLVPGWWCYPPASAAAFPSFSAADFGRETPAFESGHVSYIMIIMLYWVMIMIATIWQTLFWKTSMFKEEQHLHTILHVNKSEGHVHTLDTQHPSYSQCPYAHNQPAVDVSALWASRNFRGSAAVLEGLRGKLRVRKPYEDVDNYGEIAVKGYVSDSVYMCLYYLYINISWNKL